MKNYIICILIMTGWGCSTNPYRKSNQRYKQEVKALTWGLKQPAPDYFPDQRNSWTGTTNFDLRKPNYVIIHHTAQHGCPETLHSFTVESSKVSAHYVICKDGSVHHMLNDYLRAWQAGLSKWGNNTDINSSSVGIELDNNGFEFFTDPQINSLLILLDTLKRKYNIPTPNFIGHADIAPGRKVDPNWRFPWKQLADHGYGYWYNDTTNVMVPEGFNAVAALRIIGFNTRDSLAAMASFRRHWLQDTTTTVIDSPAAKILYELSLQYR